jgi:hypothetical protein
MPRVGGGGGHARSPIPPTVGVGGTAPGVTAATSDGYPDTNPNFSPNLTTLAFPMVGGISQNISRGFIIWDQLVSNRWGHCEVSFLFNPSAVQATYACDASDIGSTVAFHDQADDTILHLPLQQSVSFSLLFDRTYELWGSYGPNGVAKQNAGEHLNAASISDPHLSGVMADINMFKKLTGMFDNNNLGTQNQGATHSGTSISSVVSKANPIPFFQGVMILLPLWVYFGNPLGAVYYGYIQEWDLTISHWSQFMVPMRCEIDVSMALLIPPPVSTYGAGVLGPGALESWSTVAPPGELNPGQKPGQNPGGPAGRGGR